MAIRITTLSEQAFDSQLASLIGQLEGKKELPYLDTAGIPTIGIGFNLRDSDAIRNAVFDAMGIQDTATRSALTSITG